MNISILIKAPQFKWQVYFLLVNLIKMTYLTIYQIEHLINLNKKITALVKMANGL
jgi:hypothetical protein